MLENHSCVTFSSALVGLKDRETKKTKQRKNNNDTFACSVWSYLVCHSHPFTVIKVNQWIIKKTAMHTTFKARDPNLNIMCPEHLTVASSERTIGTSQCFGVLLILMSSQSCKASYIDVHCMNSNTVCTMSKCNVILNRSALRTASINSS